MNIERLFRNIAFIAVSVGLPCLIIGELFNILILRKIGIHIAVSVIVFAFSTVLTAVLLDILFNWRSK